jgi:uncharacterized membrane protein
MTVLIAGLVLFLGVHSVSIVASGSRERMIARIGAGPWRGLYSLVSLVGFVLIVYGYGLARRDPVVLYVPPLWLRNVTVPLMALVFPMLFATYLPGRIQSTLKHPMLTSIKLWATLHLLVNGMLADVLLFGSLLAWAVADRISMKYRPVRPIHRAPPSKWNDAIAVLAGLAVYALLIFGGHAWLFGVPAVL